ncbi:MAG: hypothetical protein GXO56_06900 [Chloroflexi bacterium]|nr:hypothetical protein [Chloroflexota bacterium]
MDTLSQLLIQSPGNLAYHLVLLFALGGALQAAWAQWQRAPYPQTQRLLWGLSILLGIRLAMFLMGGLAWQQVFPSHLILPIADRAATAAGILIFTWLWGFPEHNRAGDRLLGLGLGLTALMAVGTYALWPPLTSRYFNGSFPDLLWSIYNLTLAVVGLIVLARRRPDNASAGIVALSILLIGQGVHLLFTPPTGDLDGWVRFADLLAYPLLFSLPFRFAAPSAETQQRAIYIQRQDAPPPSEEALEALLRLLSTPPNHPEACARIAEAVARAFKADLCLVLAPPSHGKLGIACAYDLIRESALPGTTLPSERVPVLTAALERRRPLRLPASSTSSDLKALAQALSVSRTGPLLATPLDPGEDEPIAGGLVLLSAYAQRSWSEQEQQRLTTFAQHIARWLTAAEAPSSEPRETSPDAEQRLHELEAQIEDLQTENQRLQEQLLDAEEATQRLQTLAEAYDQLQASFEALQEENERLQAQTATSADATDAEASQLQETLAALKAENERLQEALQVLEAQHAHIQKTLAQREAELHTSPNGHDENLSQYLQLLLSSAQDLRQPLSAIVGYTDLLLSESVGILGALQRQFVERIRASTHRLEHAVDDLVRLIAMEAGEVILNPEKVDLGEAIDQALAHNSALLKEKRLILRPDIPETLPQVHLDKEILHQILHHLIRNAALASPEEGEIRLRVDVQEEGGEKFLLIEVHDSGPGIAAEDLPRVFSRRYRAEYRTIDGLGDNGLGLPLVKALTDVNGGRIWIESKPGQGTSFIVLLPLSNGESHTLMPAQQNIAS